MRLRRKTGLWAAARSPAVWPAETDL